MWIMNPHIDRNIGKRNDLVMTSRKLLIRLSGIDVLHDPLTV